MIIYQTVQGARPDTLNMNKDVRVFGDVRNGQNEYSFSPVYGPTGESDHSTAQGTSVPLCDGQKREDALQKESQGRTSPLWEYWFCHARRIHATH